MDISAGLPAVYAAAETLKNWGRWGDDDQIGTLNHIRDEDVVAAAGLVKRGKIFAMGIPLNNQGPQSGLFGGRWNPIHTMLATGTDAVAGRFDQGGQTLRYADDALNMPVQAATHWDSLGHIFLDDKMYNGHDARRVDSGGVHVLGIEHARAKMVGRGVLLDVARYKKMDWLPDGYGISNAELDAVAAAQGVEIRRADFVATITASICSSAIVRGPPGRGSSSSPSSRLSMNRRRHLPTVAGATPIFTATCWLSRPWAQANTIFDRDAKNCADFARRDQRTSCSRSSSDNTNSAFGRPVLAIHPV